MIMPKVIWWVADFIPTQTVQVLGPNSDRWFMPQLEANKDPDCVTDRKPWER